MVELELTYEQLYKLYGKGEHEVPYEVTICQNSNWKN